MANDITFMRVKTIAPITVAACGLFGACAAVGSNLVSIFEEVNTPNPQRTFLSANNGQTWTENHTDNLTGYRWDGRIKNIAANTLLTGGTSGIAGPGPLIARTTDGGLSWTGVYNPTPAVNSTVKDFAVAPNGVIWASAGVKIGGVFYWALKSLDGGSTWTTVTTVAGPLYVYAGAAVVTGNGIILLGIVSLGGPPVVLRSADDGGTWTEITLPTADFVGGSTFVRALADLGSGTVIAGGYGANSLGFPPRTWVSHDDGATWTETSAAIAGVDVTTGDFYETHSALALGGHRVLIGIDSDPNLGSFKPWRLSEDNGLTYPIVCTVGTAFGTPGYGEVTQIGPTADGAVVVTINRAINLANPWQGEIWRGVLSGFTESASCGAFIVGAAPSPGGGAGIPFQAGGGTACPPLYVFFADGHTLGKDDGVTVSRWGIAAPTLAP